MENPSKLPIREIYTTFQGEQNLWGIGTPVIFVRLQGCKIRCYKKTHNTLCDTPMALAFTGGKDMTPYEIVMEAVEKRNVSGVNVICISGGDPLHHDLNLLAELIRLFVGYDFRVSIETSGIDSDVLQLKYLIALPETYPTDYVSFVIDYKGISAGIPKSNQRNILLKSEQLAVLTNKDYVKFVIYDINDFNEFYNAMKFFVMEELRAEIVIGCYWQSPHMNDISLFKLLEVAGFLNVVKMNFQVHKMALLAQKQAALGHISNFDSVQI